MRGIVRKKDVIEAIHKEFDEILNLDESGEYIAGMVEEVVKYMPPVNPWSAVRTILEELEHGNEKLNINYYDAKARIKAISKIAESDQTSKQKVDGIKPLAGLEVGE